MKIAKKIAVIFILLIIISTPLIYAVITTCQPLPTAPDDTIWCNHKHSNGDWYNAATERQRYTRQGNHTCLENTPSGGTWTHDGACERDSCQVCTDNI